MTPTPLTPALTKRSGIAPAPSGAPSKACVYYDGACPVCRAEIATYQGMAGAQQLHWVDAASCSPEDLGAGLPRGEALARLHVRRADGSLVQGAAAFVAIWSALPRWRWLARLAQGPGVLPVLEMGYRVFLRLRPVKRHPELTPWRH